MAYKRKTEDEFDIEGDYGQGFEIVTCETTRPLARDTIKTYRANEPGIAFRIRHHRVPIEGN
jgi:DNA polymerase IIIc chi subunit